MLDIEMSHATVHDRTSAISRRTLAGLGYDHKDRPLH
jgi:hypothetical protein